MTHDERRLLVMVARRVFNPPAQEKRQTAADVEVIKLIQRIQRHAAVEDHERRQREARYSPAGNYCSTCDVHDEWCPHVHPPPLRSKGGD